MISLAVGTVAQSEGATRPKDQPAPAPSLRRGSAGWHSGPQAHPHISAHTVVLGLAKMSAKPAFGFMNEPSRQILAGGSVGN